jgi:FkbM family methyltransferase
MSPKLVLPSIELEIDTKPGDIIVDCGANIGGMTSLFARTGARVYAFEPHPLCFSVMSKRFSAVPTVTCFNRGVMDRACTLGLVTKNPHDQWDDLDTTVASSFMLGQNSGTSKIAIECIDLSEFIFSLGSRVRLAKLDIEGAEIGVINRLIDTGAIDLIDLVLVETHEKQMPFLLEQTEALKQRIKGLSLESKFRLDWI